MTRWLKRIAIILVLIIAILFVLIAAVRIFGSEDQRLGLAMMWASIVGNHYPPSIAREGVVPDGEDWMMPEPASTKFTAILRKKFPVGSDVRAMQSALTTQGFEVDTVTNCEPISRKPKPGGFDLKCRTRPLTNALRYDWGGPVCDRWLRASWAVDGRGRILTIVGEYGAVCL